MIEAGLYRTGAALRRSELPEVVTRGLTIFPSRQPLDVRQLGEMLYRFTTRL